MNFLLLFDILLYKEFVLPIVLAVIAAYQSVRANAEKKEKVEVKDKLNELEEKSASQKIIFEMIDRYEKEYTELNDKYLILRKLYNQSYENKEEDSGSGNEAKD